ncbi:MAG: hypothetical protein K2X59_10905 [Sphingomonas sp.]|nr:hypothetical protein [Sphingomonas sp.]
MENKRIHGLAYNWLQISFPHNTLYMRELSAFSATEWLRLQPLVYAYKQLRNDLVLSRYLGEGAEGEEAFLESLSGLKGKNILLVTAFEQPLALHWLLFMAKRHVSGFTFLVFDNSKKADRRAAIKAVCQRHNTPYLALPANASRHVNRHHAMAMTWVYERIVRKIEPGIFGFIDHDLIPIADTNPAAHMVNQDCYGRLNTQPTCWSLWAGFCLFRYSRISRTRLNFMYDFSRQLDTGGRNWETFYRHLDKATLVFPEKALSELTKPDNSETRTAQIIDKAWVHIQGIGYNDNFDRKRAFFTDYFRALGVPPLDLESLDSERADKTLPN